MLVSRRIFYLAILDLYELPQILVFFLKGFVLLRGGLLLLFGLHDAGFVVLLLFTKLGDLLLKITHELVLLTDHAGDSLLAIEKHVVLLIGLIFEFRQILRKLDATFLGLLQLALQMPDLVLVLLLLALVLLDVLLVQLLHRLL